MANTVKINPTRRVLSALMALALFFGLAVSGGVLAAGFAVPAVLGASEVVEQSREVFDELPTELAEVPLSATSTMYAADGTELATFFSENRIVVPLTDIAEIAQLAVVAVEDKRFYEHAGIDPRGMLRSFMVNQLTDSFQGGSTITQQYVKNVLIDQATRSGDAEALEANRSEDYNRKLREAKLAISLEKIYTKEEILERYLNIAAFGRSVYGIEAAANYYFGKTAAKLNYLEAATLAGTTQSPTKWDPELNPENAKQRRNVVLERMHEQGYITDEELEAGIATPVEETLNIQPLKLGCTPANTAVPNAGYFCDYVTKVIANDPVFGETSEQRRQLLYRGGLEIYTTLDTQMQTIADEEVRKRIPQDDASNVSAALVSIRPGTGEIVAMTQNRTYNPATNPEPGETAVNFNTDFRYGGSNGFPPGSTYKPMVLAAWLEQGHTLMETVNASPRAFQQSGWNAHCTSLNGPDWRPRNVEGSMSGFQPVEQIIYRSVNVGTVEMAYQMDLCNLFERSADLGLSDVYGNTIEALPAMVLGTMQVSPLRMANMYATFAADGVYCEPIAITRVTDADGNAIPVPTADCHQEMRPEIARAVNHTLQKVMTLGTARYVGNPSGHVAAGKTGTTNSNKHAWFIGYTPGLSTAVWTGFSEGDKAMQHIRVNGQYINYTYGSTLALPIWKAFMDRALVDEPVIPFNPASNLEIYGVMIPVPDVSNLTQDAAEQSLKGFGFNSRIVEEQEFSETVPAGSVIRTTPAAGGTAPERSTVTLIISKGPDPALQIPEPEEPEDNGEGENNGGGNNGGGDDNNGDDNRGPGNRGDGDSRPGRGDRD